MLFAAGVSRFREWGTDPPAVTALGAAGAVSWNPLADVTRKAGAAEPAGSSCLGMGDSKPGFRAALTKVTLPNTASCA